MRINLWTFTNDRSCIKNLVVKGKALSRGGGGGMGAYALGARTEGEGAAKMILSVDFSHVYV